MLLLKNTGDWNSLDVQKCNWGEIIFWNNNHASLLQSSPREGILHYPTHSWTVNSKNAKGKKRKRECILASYSKTEFWNTNTNKVFDGKAFKLWDLDFTDQKPYEGHKF